MLSGCAVRNAAEGGSAEEGQAVCFAVRRDALSRDECWTQVTCKAVDGFYAGSHKVKNGIKQRAKRSNYADETAIVKHRVYRR